MMDDVLAQFEKNATEVVRLSLTEFRGHKLIDLRVYYSDDAGQFKPTKKGVSVSVGLYTELKKAIHSLEKTLLDLNLITAEELADAELVEMDKES
jgi:hypothetical protein